MISGPFCTFGFVVFVHFGGQVVSSGQVLESKERVPVAGSSAAGIVLNDLRGEKHASISKSFACLQFYR